MCYRDGVHGERGVTRRGGETGARGTRPGTVHRGATLCDNGLVFVVDTPTDGQSAVYALDENTGATVWGPRSRGG